MPRARDDRARRTIRQATQDLSTLRDTLEHFDDRMDGVAGLLWFWGIRPPGDPPGNPPADPTTIIRWKTFDEYRQEYRDSNTTAARRLQIMAIRLGLLPLETVVAPVPVPSIP